MSMHLLPAGEGEHQLSTSCPCHPVEMLLVDGADSERAALLHQSCPASGDAHEDSAGQAAAA